MATAKTASSKTDKKSLEADIINKLSQALQPVKELLGEKKFDSRVKKAAKLFAKAVPKKTKGPKSKPAAKKPVVKAAKKAAPAKAAAAKGKVVKAKK